MDANDFNSMLRDDRQIEQLKRIADALERIAKALEPDSAVNPKNMNERLKAIAEKL